MYPKNAASPPRIAIGPVVQISDGAVQASGCSVKVLPEGGTASAGGGTVGYEEGIVHYIPTQEETNYTEFIVIAYKTGCIPASVTVVTTASATAGKVDVGAFGGTAVTGRDIGASVLLAADQAVNCTKVNGTAQTAGDLAALITTVDGIVDTIVARVVGTIAAGTHNPQTGDCYARLGAPAGASHAADVAAVKSDTAAVKAKTDNLPTDPADQSAVEAAITAATSTLATAANLVTVAGYLDTEIAAILADTDELQKAITDGGRTDNLIDAIKAKTDLMLDAAAIRTAVGLAAANLDTQLADLPTVAEFEARTLVAASYGTAANQTTIAAYIDTEVAAILAAVDTEVAAIKAKTDNLPTDPADQSAVEAAVAAVQSHGDSAWATATSVTVSDKTGFKLASDGLDSVATTAPTGPASNFREMLVQMWRRFFKGAKRTYSGGTQQIVTYADNGTTPITTQTISDDGTTETQGVAS